MKQRTQYLRYDSLSVENIAAAVSAVDAFLDGNNADWQKREALPNARSGRRN